MSTLLSDDVTAFIDALASGRRGTAVRLAVDLLDRGATAEHLILNVLAPAQTAIGTRWASGELTVSQERLATSIADLVLDLAAARRPVVQSRGRLVLACAEREHHNLPARMVAELLRLEGFAVFFIGSPRDASSLVRVLPAAGADALVLSCSIGCNLLSVPEMVSVAHQHGVRVLAGGRAFGVDDRRAVRLGADAWAGTVPDCASVLDRWRELGPREPRGAFRGDSGDELPGRRVLQYRASLVDVLATHLSDDATHVVDFLLASAACDDQKVFADYVAWLRERRPDDLADGVDDALADLRVHVAQVPELARVVDATPGA